MKTSCIAFVLAAVMVAAGACTKPLPAVSTVPRSMAGDLVMPRVSGIKWVSKPVKYYVPWLPKPTVHYEVEDLGAHFGFSAVQGRQYVMAYAHKLQQEFERNGATIEGMRQERSIGIEGRACAWFAYRSAVVDDNGDAKWVGTVAVLRFHDRNDLTMVIVGQWPPASSSKASMLFRILMNNAKVRPRKETQ